MRKVIISKTRIAVLFLSLSTLIRCQTEPHDVEFFKNYREASEVSFLTNKPLFIHFTCYGCMGYNEFTDDLITDKKISKRLNKSFITVQLYVDDKQKIEKTDTIGFCKIDLSQQGIELLRNAKTTGEVNQALQIGLFNSNNQPLYAVIDSEGNLIKKPFGYSGKNASAFLSNLEDRLDIVEK